MSNRHAYEVFMRATVVVVAAVLVIALMQGHWLRVALFAVLLASNLYTLGMLRRRAPDSSDAWTDLLRLRKR